MKQRGVTLGQALVIGPEIVYVVYRTTKEDAS